MLGTPFVCSTPISVEPRLPPVLLTVVLIVHMLLAVAIVALVLIQRSEGGGLGIGGGTMGGLMSVRSAGNFLTRLTGIVMGLFFVTSLTLAILSGVGRTEGNIFALPPGANPAPSTTPEASHPTAPGGPASVPAPAQAPADGAAAPATEAPAPAAPAPNQQGSSPVTPGSENAPSQVPTEK